MFKTKIEISNFVKRQLAMVLALILALNTFVTAGLSMTPVNAETPEITEEVVTGEILADKLVEWAAAGSVYRWYPNNWGRYRGSAMQVDCRSYVNQALLNIFGTCTNVYMVTEDGRFVRDANGNKIKLGDDLASWKHDGGQESFFDQHKNTRWAIIGNGMVAYYWLRSNEWDNESQYLADMSSPTGGAKVNSLWSYYAQYPGSIFCSSAHTIASLGEFHSKAELLAKYPQLDRNSALAWGDVNLSPSARETYMIQWYQSAYDVGETYAKDDIRYYFGKTVFIHASGTNVGIKAVNYGPTGKSNSYGGVHHSYIMQAEVPPKTKEVSFMKFDASIEGAQIGLPNAEYQLYYDYECTKPYMDPENPSKPYVIKTEINPVTLTLPIEQFYIKETKAPAGYKLDPKVYSLDVAKVDSFSLSDETVSATLIVWKVDEMDQAVLQRTTMLNKTELWVQEYGSETAADGYEDICKLVYDPYVPGFVLPASYTSLSGATYTDGLHWTQLNNGKFRIVEKAAQPGYQFDPLNYEFNVLDGNLNLRGQESLTNRARLSLKINKVDVTGKAIEGVKFRLTCGGYDETKFTDANGVVIFDGITDDGINQATLYELEAPEGYLIPKSYAEGYPVALTKSPDSLTQINGVWSFQTKILVINGVKEDEDPDDPGEPELFPEGGYILIQKTDASIVDTRPHGVEDAKYTVYTSPLCTEDSIAVTRDNVKLKDVATLAGGMVYVGPLDFGTYYIKETQAPDGYAIQTNYFEVHLQPNEDDLKTNYDWIERTPAGIADLRQTVDISIKKVDSISGKPVQGAVYKLKNLTDLISPQTGTTIPANSVIGLYTTDENGMIHLTKFDQVAVTNNGEGERIDVVGELLPNGIYQFKEVSAPMGYAINNDPTVINASWQDNKNNYQIPADENKGGPGVVTAEGVNYILNTVTIKDVRVPVSISIQKHAEGNTTDLSVFYQFTDYNKAAALGYTASLEGTTFTIAADEDMISMNGEFIAANTILGTYKTDASGKVVATEMQGRFAGQKFPMGIYNIWESQAPRGFSINTDVKIVQATSTENTYVNNADDYDEAIINTIFSTVIKDDLLYQPLEITKVDAGTNEPLAGVTFKIYSVSELLSQANITYEQLPWILGTTQANGKNLLSLADINGKKGITSLINESGAKPFATPMNKDEEHYGEFKTDADGKIIVSLPYDDYIIVETAGLDTHVAPETAYYVRIPSVLVSENNYEYYDHDPETEPRESYNLTVSNKKNDYVPTFDLNILKTDGGGNAIHYVDANGNYTANPAKFAVYDTEGNQIFIGSTDKYSTIGGITPDGQMVSKITDKPLGTYIIKELEAPEGYIGISSDITLVVNEYGATATMGETPVDVIVNNINGRMVVSVQVVNEAIEEPTPPPPSNTTKLSINKFYRDGNTMKPLGGAVLAIQNSDGTAVSLNNEVLQWTTTEEEPVHVIEGLAPGSYKLVEISAPNGYELAEPQPFTLIAGQSLTLSMEDTLTPPKPTKLTVIKYTVDDNGVEQPLAGATLSVVDSNGNVVELNGEPLTWVSTTEPHVIEGLAPGYYEIREESAPAGYVNNQGIQSVTLTEESDITKKILNTKEEEPTPPPAPTTLTIEKYTTVDGNRVLLAGATLAIVDENFETVILDGTELVWTSTGEAHVIVGLPAGTYYLEERVAPEGYDLNTNRVEITLNESDNVTYGIENTLTPIPDPTVVNINKYYIEDGDEKPVVGATLAVFDATNPEFPVTLNGQSVQWVTTAEEVTHVITGLPAGSYFVREIVTPEGYETAADLAFTLTESQTVSLKMKDEVKVPEEPPVTPDVNTVTVNKFQIRGNEKVPVAGAVLAILNANGDIVEVDGVELKWTTTADNMTMTIVGLPQGDYIVREISAPAGYIKAADQPFHLDTKTVMNIDVENKMTKVVVEKLDAVHHVDVPGAELAILDSNKQSVQINGTPIVWTSNDDSYVIYGLPVGNYYLSETTAPDGYVKYNDLIPFEVKAKLNGFGVSTEAETVQLFNERAMGKIVINKTDSKNNPLAGVKFELRALNTLVDPITKETIHEKDDVIASVTTDKQGHAEIVNIPIGTYGYVDANDTEFFKNDAKYVLVETETAPGAQYEKIDPIEITFNYDNADMEWVKTLVNNEPEITVSKKGSIPTFTGKFDERDNITVVQKNDLITYTITVKNNSSAAAHNIVVKDVVPVGTVLVPYADDTYVKLDNDNELFWEIEKLDALDEVNLKFTVKVVTDTEQMITNVAQYQMAETIPTGPNDPVRVTPENFDEDKAQDTNYVIYQTISFNKSSDPAGGNNADVAPTDVVPGQTIHYVLNFKFVEDVNAVKVMDQIPAGLQYVSGSAKINGQVDESATYNKDNRLLTFSTINAQDGDKTNNNINVIKFEFDVKVEQLTTKKVVFANTASVTFNKQEEYDNESIITDTIISNTVTHKTERDYVVTKSATPTTFMGEASEAEFTTVLKKDNVVTYTLTVTNKTNVPVQNIVIKDKVPAGMTLVENSLFSSDVSDNVTAWLNEDGTMTWLISELKGDEIKVGFKATVNKQEAQLIVNTADYDVVPDADKKAPNAPQLPDDCKQTQDVVHQVVEFHKTSTIVGGTNENDAANVKLGDVITYTLEIYTKDKVNVDTITDAIPDGLSFVDNSLSITHVNGETTTEVAADINYDKETNTLNVSNFTANPGKTYIKFKTTVEKAPEIFINQAKLVYKTNDGKETADLDSETVSHMTVANIKFEGNKNAELPTYVGAYENRNNVTVVKDGQELKYTITITNTGETELKNVVIRDKIPEFTKVKGEIPDGGQLKDGYATWTIASIAPGKSAVVHLNVEVASNGTAQEIINQAEYAVPDDANNIKDDEWKKTDMVIYQTTALKKSASIKHGVDGADAVNVAIGTTFTYTITLEHKDDVYGVSITDKLPKGLSFVEKSAKYKMADGTEVSLSTLKPDDKGVLTIPEIEKLVGGNTVFSFDVKVEDVAEYDRDYFFINQANATVAQNKDSDKDDIALESNTVSNKTVKTNKTDTPQLGFNGTDKSVMWALISVLSALGTLAVGAYCVILGRKKNQ